MNMPPKDNSRGNQFSKAFESLNTFFGDRFSVSESIRLLHGKDESYHQQYIPDAVVFPYSTQEVSKLLTICSDFDVPVIPYGAGTSLEGHIAALHGGVSVDMMQMNKIIGVNFEDLDCKVMAGVTRKQLNNHLKDSGLFFPVDPGADASIGGMAATRASGTNAVRYGTMRENILSLTVVMPDGKIISTAGRARKSSAGYDLTRLFVGSEGTLGIITEVSLKLYGIPEAISVAACHFETVNQAVDSVIETIQMGIPVARIEFADEVQIDAINKFSKMNNPVVPTLWLEFHGTESSVKEQAESVQLIMSSYGGSGFKWTIQQEEKTKLWQARHDAAYAAAALRPGSKIWATDVCVPISKLSECIVQTKNQLNNISIPAPIVGHVGDGNFHICFVINPENQSEIEEAKKINNDLIERAISMDGTCSGEHGVGYGKVDFLFSEHGAALDVMHSIKNSIDPKGIMNPGKILSI